MARDAFDEAIADLDDIDDVSLVLEESLPALTSLCILVIVSFV